VKLVSNAQAAIAALTDVPPPDLVFSDIVMAGDLDGLALARRLRDEAPRIPVLLATGYSQEAERIGDEFPILRKPYKLAELGRAVASIIIASRSVAGNLVPIDAARRARAARQEKAR
jgi:CheY-like chemotaxis protein